MKLAIQVFVFFWVNVMMFVLLPLLLVPTLLSGGTVDIISALLVYSFIVLYGVFVFPRWVKRWFIKGE